MTQVYTAGGGPVLTHYLITWETDGQHNTREGSPRSAPTHCLMFNTIAVQKSKNCTLLYLTGEDDIARFDSW